MSTRTTETHTDRTHTAALCARGVEVTFGSNHVLTGVDLDIRHGEVVALVGPNGAGKSTLLSVLSGDLEPTAGTVELDGVAVAGQKPLALARRRAVLVQKQSLAFGFRAREVVEMGRSVWHRTEKADADDEMVDWAMDVADVTHLSDRVVPTLSGGEQARVAFARLLAQDVEVHLLDEPTAALDIKHQEGLLRQARDSADRGAAVVVVLHDLSLAAAYSDRIAVLSGGRIRACGTPHDVLTSELVSEVYEHPCHVVEHAGHLMVVPLRTSVHRTTDHRTTEHRTAEEEQCSIAR
ncbi:heme ABC transporter ATP-binding protein [Nocardioides yefusunii]|uniref:Heme ABC transporter ATP-binding protein n=1 Tax=Nocardioides yefusunii TaxID=2500546 RepID=A0ABW1R0L2_9ACTN|nr:heme ABC transporter ATP-binding protein [Nocardioides yefusunii]